MKRHDLHVTDLRSFLECPEKFRKNMKAKMREKGVSGIKATVGTAVDKAITTALNHKINTGRLPRVADCLDITERYIKRAFRKGVRLTQAEERKDYADLRDDAVERAARLYALYHREVAKHLKPTHTQLVFSIKLDTFLESRGIKYPVDLVGTMDVLEAGVIRDTKTTVSDPDQSLADDSFQLSGYALGHLHKFGALPDKMCLDYLVDNSKGTKLVTLETKRDISDVGVFLDDVASCIEKIADKDFEPNPSWKCKMCSHYYDCEFAKR